MVDGGADNDKLINIGNEVTLLGDAGKDTLTSSGNDVLLDGGAGADKISLGTNAQNTTIIGGTGNDTITLNDNAQLVQYATGDGNDVIFALSKDDSIQITSGSISATAKSGSDIILTVGSNKITLKGIVGDNFYIKDNTFIMEPTGPCPPSPFWYDKANKITNTNDDMIIYAKGGADTINNSGNDVSINGGTGNDKIIDSGNKTTIRGEAGKDTIIASGNDGLLDGGAGDDRISLGVDVQNTTIIGGTGNDNIYLNDNAQLIQYAAGDGKDTITGFGGNDSIQITSGTIRTSVKSGSNMVLYVGEGTDNAIVIRNGATDLNGFSIKNNVFARYWYIPPIEGTDKANKITNTNDDMIIYAKYGNDTINNFGDQALIDGGAGNDKISIGGDSANNTIIGGKGNDTIYSNCNGNLIQYASGDGKDVIVGFSETDSLQLTAGSVKASAKSGGDFIVTVGSGTIKFKGLGNEKFQMDNGSIAINPTIPPIPPFPVGTGYADKLNNTYADATIYALAGNDTITNTANNAYIDGGAGNDKISLGADSKNNTLVGGKGNDSIYTNGNGNLIQYASKDGKDTIVGFGGDDSIQITSGKISKSVKSGGNIIFAVGSSSITVKDGADKFLEIKDNVIALKESLKPVTLTSNEDTYVNEDDVATIYAVAGNDTITNVANNAYIDGGAGNDVISLGAETGNNTLVGGKGNDSIYTNGNGNLIRYETGNGRDSIFGFGDDDSIQITSGKISKSVVSGSDRIFYVGDGVSNSIVIKDSAKFGIEISNNIISKLKPITLGTTADRYANNYEYATISALAGNDTITNTANNVYIDAGVGNDKISLDSDFRKSTLIGGKGNDTIYSNGNENLIQYASGDGKDVIVGFGYDDSVQITSGTIRWSIKSGNDMVFTVDSDSITFKDGANMYFSVVDNVITLLPPCGAINPIYPTRINVKYDNSTVYAISGNDTITNIANNVYIDGGADNDSISLKSYSANNTLIGGKGNDTIWTNGNGNLIQYADGDGRDTIVGFGYDDSIQITSGSVRKSVKSGSDMVFAVGKSSITVKDVANMDLDISDEIISISHEPVPITLTKNPDKYNNAEDDATIYAVAGNDTITNTANNCYIDGGAGNDKISLSADSKNNTLVGGKGTDTIYTNGNGNLVQYASGDGKDTIVGFGGDDSIQITSGEISKSVKSGGNMVFAVGSSSITVKDGAAMNLSVVDNVICMAYTSELLALNDTTDTSSLFADDNFVTDSAQIDSITEVSATNYSVGKIEDSASYGKLTNDTLSTVYTYSNDK